MRDRDTPPIPVGKLPPQMLTRLLAAAPVDDPRVLLGPGVGLDCGVIDLGGQLLVCKSDPVTFASDRIGDYLVQVNADDLATTGATPSWLLVTLLLPENAADEAMAEGLMGQIGDTCRELSISLFGGHTENLQSRPSGGSGGPARSCRTQPCGHTPRSPTGGPLAADQVRPH
jgi:hydrogenase expression/formation protein HypE